MKDWHSEEEIKSRLRELIEATRKARSELDAMMRSHDLKPERQYLHRQAWPQSAAVNDRRRRKKVPD